ncbi:MAG: FG-GAP-like repeat-containing protein [Planctomycetaceae bacterium]|nr:FG-GAP-like repeat-containing protein [Planctomycetaceae bacterium]
MRRVVTLLCVCLVAGALLAVFWRPSGPLSQAAADRLLETAIVNADNGHADLAYEAIERILTDRPDHHRARVVQATMSINLRRGAQAAEAIAALPDEYLASHFDDSWALAKFMTYYGFLFEAEPFLKRLLLIKPDHAAARRELLRCYRLSGENATASEHLAVALRDRKIELSDLLMTTAPLTNWASAADVKFMKTVGQKHFDPLTMLGYARREMQSGQLPAAPEVLQQILARLPGWQPALTQLAIANWQLGREDAWRQAMSTWDPATLDHADAWFIWGVWQLRHDDYPTAVRCFGEALERAPKHSGAAAQLIVTLRKLGLEAEATEWTAYVEHLTQLDHACLSVGTSHQAPDSVTAIALRCEALGWVDEARAWQRYGRQKWPDFDWPEPQADIADRSASSLGEEGDVPQRRLIAALDYRRYPLPKPVSRQAPTAVPKTIATSHAPPWRLDDEAAQLGIVFRFQNGLQPDRKQAYMFEFSGPGIGVLDYDGDGWPDLYLTQGAQWPVQEGDTSMRDELFRNLGDGTFAAVTEAAGLGEPGYSQGPAVGDLNGDGFPDVYVCNIGPNRCYLNNGDGTFTEVTAETGTAGDDWSLSAAWADFNQDGLPDLYVVNYLAGDVLEHACVGKDGRRIQCEPTFFPGADDRLYLNRGDGTFQDISEEAGILIPDGKGMGIVVGRLQDSRQAGIFLANDMTPNFLFAPQGDSSSIPRFENVGAIAGVAFGPQGTAQSSMGVAAGDVNGDGRLDLFVTNFLSETSNLFLQGPEGSFEDAANRFGLTAGGLLTEGWGAQFLDVNADGHLDLFVANGHLEEYVPTDRMPSQLFRNLNGEKFDLVSGPAIGRYFGGTYLGRAVALWDWNRDGREDLAVSHVSDPVAILTNRTESVGHRIALRLVGVRAAREPIGSQVKLTSEGRTLVRELVGGDGYTATNERRLYFGLEASADPVDVDVDWVGGDIQRFSGLEVDAEYVLIEGRSEAVLLRRYDDGAVSAVQ